MAQSTFDTILGWDKQLFPSYLLATAAMKQNGEQQSIALLGDSQGLLGVLVRAASPNTPIKVTISCNELCETSEFSGVLSDSGTTYSVLPKIRYRYDWLSRCKHATPIIVDFLVQIGDEQPMFTSQTATLRAITDCPVFVKDGSHLVDASFTLASYVNEDHPFVEKMLFETLDLGVVTRHTGYQTKDPREVIRQVYALWDLVVARGVKNCSIATTAFESESVGCLPVRLLEETINSTQSNCADSSVLFVSLLRKMGIRSRLISVPGHCYVSFALDENELQILGLETTLIDSMDEVTEAVPSLLEESVAEEQRSDASWSSFVNSILIGTKKLANDLAEPPSLDAIGYRDIDIAGARKIGIMPIPFTGTEEFIAFDYSEYMDDGENEDEEDAETSEYEEESEEE